jgi:hypothetical protein
LKGESEKLLIWKNSEKMLSLAIAGFNKFRFTMRWFQGFLAVCLTLLALLTFAPLPAQAASSAAIRAFDDVEKIVNNYAGQNLIRSEFGDANLENANFSKADLRGAVFNGAKLAKANWHGANFGDGIAYITDFSGADLSDAIFDSAMVLKSRFKGANVNGADFSGAVIDKTQVLEMCKTASGVNPVTKVDTRQSLGCP